MTIHHHIVDLTKHQALSTKHQPLVLAIGNMDGVHLGHQALIRNARAIADANGYACAALTFFPHPREYFNPALRPLTLMQPAAKIHALRNLGVEKVIFAKFDHQFAQMDPVAFIENFCIGTLGAHHIVTGDNFYFGKDRKGNVALLEHSMHRLKLGYTCVEPVYISSPCSPTDSHMGHSSGLTRPTDREGTQGGGQQADPALSARSAASCDFQKKITEANKQVISSSRIRQILSGGNVSMAADLLGGPFMLEGRVGHGQKRGRTLGFPTANIPMHGLYLPAYGVYVVRVHYQGSTLTGIANLGVRPTFDDATPVLEVHLFDWNGDLYGKQIDVELLHYLRPEHTFESKEMLVGQIKQDVLNAKAWLEG